MLGKRKLISNSWKVQISMFFNLLTDKHVSLVQFYMKCKYLFRLFQFRGVRLSEGKLSGLSSMARWGDALLETKWELRLYLLKGFCKICKRSDKFDTIRKRPRPSENWDSFYRSFTKYVTDKFGICKRRHICDIFCRLGRHIVWNS